VEVSAKLPTLKGNNRRANSHLSEQNWYTQIVQITSPRKGNQKKKKINQDPKTVNTIDNKSLSKAEELVRTLDSSLIRIERSKHKHTRQNPKAQDIISTQRIKPLKEEDIKFTGVYERSTIVEKHQAHRSVRQI
jgi:hypothetical protein